ncbi:MAG: IS21 family transposase [Actinomycetota bacterium]
MIDAELDAEIRRLHFAEHWKVGTIASNLGVHPDAVRRALRLGERKRPTQHPRPRMIDPFLPMVRETLERYPRLRATNIHAMLRERGFTGSARQVRRAVRELRPRRAEAYLRLRAFPGEEAQADWADFGSISVGRGQRRLSAFVMTLSYSRALYVEFFLDQKTENFLFGHQRAFEHFGGVPRAVRIDNLRSAVLERRGAEVRFHPRYLELAGWYHFQPRPCRPARGNEKGRVERSIGFLRESFFAGRSVTTVADLNRAVRRWCDEVAARRRWPDNSQQTVQSMFEEEQPRLLALPEHPLQIAHQCMVVSGKTIYVRFDSNDYSIHPSVVGKDLSLVATDTLIRLLDGSVEIARHARSWDRGERVTDPAHARAVLEQKSQGLGHSGRTPLEVVVPEATAFVDAAFADGQHGTAAILNRLSNLLSLYGSSALAAALREALSRGTPTLSSVDYLIEQQRRAARRHPPLPVDLGERPDLAALHVRPHALGDYDQLTMQPTDIEKNEDE